MDKSNINVAQFLSDNKNLVGFDNLGRSLYTTVKELVDNAMDSVELIRERPSVAVDVYEMDTNTLNKVHGNHEQIRKKSDLSKVSQHKSPSIKDNKALRRDLYYEITVTDNGLGIPHNDIPNLFGTVLSGTKYGNVQSRGKFGIGAKMALLWSKKSTGVPVQIHSSTDPAGKISFYTFEIDTNSNSATSISEGGVKGKLLDNKDNWRGTQIVIVIKGNFTLHHKIIEYFRQTALICPYATLAYNFSSTIRSKHLKIRYGRGKSCSKPDKPVRAKYFPTDVTFDLLQGLIGPTEDLTLLDFLLKNFEISELGAKALIAESGLDDKTELRKMTRRDVIFINHMFNETKFEDPSGDCLSVTGKKFFCSGIKKQFSPKVVKAYSEGFYVVKGHPVKIDAAVCIGGKDFREGLNIFRYANRSPLLFELSNDIIYKVANNLDWKTYKLNTKTDKIGVFVNVVSTKVPFRGIGKEYIGGDVDSEMGIAVKASLEACCKELLPQTKKMAKEQADMDHKKTIETYNRHVAGAVAMMLNDAVKLRAKGKQQRKALDTDDPYTRNFTDSEFHQKLLEDVGKKSVTKDHLLKKLGSLLIEK